MNFNDFPTVMSIIALLIGITFLILSDYIAAGVWLCYGLATLLVNKVGSSNMDNFSRIDVIIAWATIVSFISLLLFQLHRDFVAR
ncbi:MAG: hypothetical protein EA343_06860 [Nodularia sp. (in: Bacteria)]|nr:MAG: hypothetical protein EA343_06860 [Nodularia sp. (in: cyanobacteria)]